MIKEEKEIFEEIEKLLTEQAQTVDNAEKIVTNLGNEILEHLIKVLLYGPDNPSILGWFRELNAWFLKIANIKLKTNNKYIPFDLVRKWLASSLYDSDTNTYDKRTFLNLIDAEVIGEYKEYIVAKDLLRDKFDEFTELLEKLMKSCADEHSYSLDLLTDVCYSWFDKYPEIYYKE